MLGRFHDLHFFVLGNHDFERPARDVLHVFHQGILRALDPRACRIRREVGVGKPRGVDEHAVADDVPLGKGVPRLHAFDGDPEDLLAVGVVGVGCFEVKRGILSARKGVEADLASEEIADLVPRLVRFFPSFLRGAGQQGGFGLLSAVAFFGTGLGPVCDLDLVAIRDRL